MSGHGRALLTHTFVAGAAIALWATAPPAAAVAGTAGLVIVAAWVLGRSAGAARTAAGAEAAARLQAELSDRLETFRADVALRDGILEAMEEAVILVERGSVAYANGAARALLGAHEGRPPPPQVPLDGPGDFDVHHPTFRSLRSVATEMPGGKRVVVAQDVTETERTDAIRRDFVANASHELKTPVAAILATAETLRAAVRDDPEAAVRFADSLAREAARLSAMIQDLLDLARLEQPRADGAPTSWTALVRTALEEARPAAERKRITLTAELGDDDVVVAGRAQDLAQLARNLLDNAISYTPDGGTIAVHLSARGAEAVLSVTDDGIGIPAAQIPRIFERFYRVDRARARDTGGTGLGLSIVKHVAETHDGRVHVESQLGRGSTFTVTLPLARS